MNIKPHLKTSSQWANLIERARDWTTEADLETISQAMDAVSDESLHSHGLQALVNQFDKPVETRTKSLIRGWLHGAEPSPLKHLVNKGEVRLGLTFAGQAQDYIQDLERLFQIPSSRGVIEAAAAALLEELDNSAGLMGLHPMGLDVLAWIKNPALRPSETYLASSAVSQPLILVTQVAQLAALVPLGFETDRIKNWCQCITGHSQGIMAAVIAAEGLNLEDLSKRCALVARYMLWQGIEMQAAFGPALDEGHAMAAISGLDLDVLEKFLENTDVCISLQNAFRRFVVSGHPRSVESLLQHIESDYVNRQKAYENGQSSRPSPVLVERLKVSAPFHSSLVSKSMGPLLERMKTLGLKLEAKNMTIPVLRYETGEVWGGECLIESQTINQVNWPRALAGLRAYEITHVLDLGPGAGVSAISALEVRGYGIGVIPVASAKGEASLRSADRIKESVPAPWWQYAPTVVTRTDGSRALENLFTLKTGYPPIFVPGMTPTTVEAPIVAASANAGFLAELAGGGQTSESIFRTRANELKAKLKPGAGYLINTLYLDPYLWQLQIGRQRLVQKLRSEGHPILGVTITAGLPPKDEALNLLNEFIDLGMTLNSLKVGSAAQISQALEIADEFEGTLILQVEGGAAGGHHSFDNLTELLLEWYPRIRRRTNCLLTVGGGIANGDRVAEFLSGTWSTEFGLPLMPVDAVYLGTALMACSEASTSEHVKNALVQTKGTPKFVARGASVGGVRSGRSGLGADIHYVDNHAARTSAYLDSVAGDGNAVQANRQKIIQMLGKTAKPYVGDLETMTYKDLLFRLMDLMALGKNGAYENGVWLDITHRERFRLMVTRALERCETWSGQVELSDLDAPREFVTRLIAHHGGLERRILLEDQRYFVNHVCSIPGKPVPFVPVIDENVRRWYCSDALWQSHDSRYSADEVLIIPGPNAVLGIKEANQPVAEMLLGFLDATYSKPLPTKTEDAPQLLEIAINAERLITMKGAVKNPLAAIMKLRLDNVEIREIEDGVRLEVNHSLPHKANAQLQLDFEVRAFEAEKLYAKDDMVDRIRTFYSNVMPDELTIDANRIDAYRRVAGDRGPALPEQLFFAVSLPKIMEALLDPGLGLNPASLLHLSSEIESQNVTTVDQLHCHIRNIHAKDDHLGRTVVVDCDISDDATVVASCQQRFLIREVTGTLSAEFANPPFALSDEPIHSYSITRKLFEQRFKAPSDLNAFSHISGDLNPIHRDQAVAMLAGLSTPIVHGQWTAAKACALLVGDTHTLVRSRAEFLAPVLPSEELTFRGEVVGLSRGHERCLVTVSNSNGTVLKLEATRTAPKTAVIFPGQGSQRRGMGMEQYEKSKSARAIWDKADHHTRTRYGFSILDVVRHNPKFMRVGSDTVEHPEGVLNVTQFTQVALTVLSVAGVAELRENQILPDDTWFCGHSVGEYSALAAVINLFPLENLVDAVYHRGITMQEYIERDESGRSDYLMGVIRPHRIGLTGAEAIELIEAVHADTDFPIYVVNHNIEGKQYAVAGHLSAIRALKERLAPLDPKDEGWVNIPGIDVPFHSPLLKDGVNAFREVLEGCIPLNVDIERLTHRYIPNLVARPFELTDAFLDEMIEATGGADLEHLRANLEQNGRAVLIELLAWQFASPVRWIETQAILNADVERTIEVGPKGAPVLSNMFAGGFKPDALTIEVLHAQRDFEKVYGEGIEEVKEAVSHTNEVRVETSAPRAPAPIAPPLSPTAISAPALDDEGWSIKSALMALLSLRLNVPITQLSPSDTIDELLGGNSARRNQILLDLGKEFGVGAIDGAHELPLDELAVQLKSAVGVRYAHPGACLKAAQNEALSNIGTSRKEFASKLLNGWGLGPQRSESVLTFLAISPELQSAPEPAEKAAQMYAQFEGVTLSTPKQGQTGGATVDAAAVAALEEQISGRWKHVARAALAAAGLNPTLVDRVPAQSIRPDKPKLVAQSFDSQKHIAFTQVSQWVKSDATRWFFAAALNERPALPSWLNAADEKTVSLIESLCRKHCPEKTMLKYVKGVVDKINRQLDVPLRFRNETAIVTGAGKGSIAEAIVCQLLAGGATVVVSCSRLTNSRRAHFKEIYRQHAGRGSSLHLVPLNQGNLDDVASFCEWLYNPEFETKGADRVLIKRPWTPTLFFPFGAMPAEGDPTTIDDQIIESLKVNLIGVEALVGQLAVQHKKAGILAPIGTVLPLSPNHGQMGRDGLYAEAKIGLEALMQRRAAEFDRWGAQIELTGTRIGWVRGTGLMAALDKVYEKVEADLGITTFSTTEMATLILGATPLGARESSVASPQIHDFTGGFSQATGLRDTINRALAHVSQSQRTEDKLDGPVRPYVDYSFPNVSLDGVKAKERLNVEDAICIVGFGEIGPYGNAQIRWDYEKNGKSLSTAAALELAVWCGCIKYQNTEWVDASTGDPVQLHALDETYGLSERIGLRLNEQFNPDEVTSFTEVMLEHDTAFNVPDRVIAEAFLNADPTQTEIFDSGEGFTVVRKKGAKIRVPKLDPIDRDIAGQIPKGYDPVRLGVDPQNIEQIDPVSIYNLLATSDAFRSAGLTPEDLWQHIHPGRIASTQGSGIGGMRAQRRLYTESQLGENKQSDVLQETLINVTAAYAGMMFHGGYGAMINPVAACATAAISVEIAVDLLSQDKADFVVAGAFDDFSTEGARGFAEMQATIAKEARIAKGIEPDQASRPCDVRRAGFVEAQGGGTLLLCRLKTAMSMGLPIYSIVAGAWSGSDGIQRSVPAPGPGILRIGAGGKESPLAQSLKNLGLDGSDIGAISIHGTSTMANDKNETDLHSRLAKAIGRDPFLPIPVIAQKAITGHAKGGAAAWQINGLIQAMHENVIPGMPNLDDPDPVLNMTEPLVFSDRNVEVNPGGLKAGLVTSLGFGHVAGAVCLVHPDVALAHVPSRDKKAYLSRREKRETSSRSWKESILLGEKPYFEARTESPFNTQQELDLLLGQSDLETK